MEDPSVFARFEVQELSTTKHIEVLGEKLGDLRSAIKLQFDIPSFEQKIMYTHAGFWNYSIELQGDDSVNLKEKLGLMDSKMLFLSRQVDPRYKMEKETAFLEALVACRFVEAKDILQSSGFSIDPNCVHKYHKRTSGQFGSFGSMSYAHPALTVAIQAGNAPGGPETVAIRTSSMSKEKELCEIVELLIQRGADVNGTGEETEDCQSGGAPTAHDKTPLCAAVERGSPTLVKILLDAGANPDHTHRYSGSAYTETDLHGLGNGVCKPESWLGSLGNGSVLPISHFLFRDDPRRQYSDEILALLRKLPRVSVLMPPGDLGCRVRMSYKKYSEPDRRGNKNGIQLYHVSRYNCINGILPGSPVHKHGVEVGWRVGLLAGEPCSKERYTSLKNGKESYTMTFFQDPHTPQGSRPVDKGKVLGAVCGAVCGEACSAPKKGYKA